MAEAIKIGNKIKNLNDGIAELNAMGDANNQQAFTYNKISGNVGYTGIETNGVIVMDIANNGSISNEIHESSYGYDLWQNGRYTINERGNYMAGEVKAYSRQFAYDKGSLPRSNFGRANSLSDINHRWVLGINSRGEYIYT